MFSRKEVMVVVLALIFLTLFSSPSSAMDASIKAGYWPSWSNSYAPPSSINTKYFSHLFFAFVDMDPATYQLVVSESQARLLSEFTSALHGHTKTLLSIGGGGSDPAAFARMAANSTYRKAFIDSTISVARKYNFEGLDLDWESPRNPEEMQRFAELLQDWRLAINEEAVDSGQPCLLLTAAVYFSSSFWLSNVPRAYPVSSIKANLDWINLMCYDYHGSWDTSATGAPAGLYDPKSNISTSYGVQTWAGSGMPPEMLVIGLPAYGRTWTLKDPSSHGIGAPAVGVGPGDNGVLTYSQVVDFNKVNNSTVTYDRATVSTYSYAGTAWIGYDDVTSIKGKIQFARAHGLKGYFFWAVSYDKNWRLSEHAFKTWGK